jgi:inward rectifier potassium channel
LGEAAAVNAAACGASGAVIIVQPGSSPLNVIGGFLHKQPAPSEIEVVGAPRTPFSDLYQELLRAPWWLDLLGLIGVFLLLNLLFAFGYMAVGGVAGTDPKSLADHFFFSVQTMGTIGYGTMHPLGASAQVLVTCEVIVGLSLIAMTSGLLFAKFSVPRARMQFAESATISPFNGVPTLMFRIGNERASQIIEAHVRVVLVRTEHTAEGVLYYRMRDLPLERDHSPALARSWTVMHRIDESSPLYGASPETLVRDEVEFMLTVLGIDEISAQNLHARHTYDHQQVRWGARPADMLSEMDDGRLKLDMRAFHRLMPTQPTPSFPYPTDSTE